MTLRWCDIGLQSVRARLASTWSLRNMEYRNGLLVTTSALALVIGWSQPAQAAPAAACGGSPNIVDTGTTCPPIVNSGSLSSITVRNGAVVSAAPTVVIGSGLPGVLPTPAPGSGASIFNTGTGTIANGSGNAILITNGSTLLGSIINAGQITSASDAGIRIRNNSVLANGSGITNTGTISSAKQGIVVQNSASFTGPIVNTGGITSSNSAGIALHSNGTYAGTVTNGAGATIQSQHDGIHLGFGGEGSGVFSGLVTNAGSITSAGSGYAGIGARASSLFSGTIANSGAIVAQGTGIWARSRNFTGSIANSGSIDTAQSGTNSYSAGIVVNASTFGGTVSNAAAGTIKAKTTGISVAAGFTNSGTITNAGSIVIGSNSTITSLGVTNSGIVNNSGNIANALGVGGSGTGIAARAGVYSGNIFNSGNISSPGIGIGAQASTFSGKIVNSGMITAGPSVGATSLSGGGPVVIASQTAAGIGIGLSGGTFSGTVSNTAGAAITASTAGIFVGNLYGGMRTNSGVITNAGTITVTNNFGSGTAIAGIAAGATSYSGSVVNSGTIKTNGASGITIYAQSNFSGNVTNSGTIDLASVVKKAAVSGSGPTVISQYAASGAGIQISTTSFSGTVTNTAGAAITGGSYGISIAASTFASSGLITNAGTITADYRGIGVYTSTFAGTITNSGKVAGGRTGIRVDAYSAFTGGITNSGTITSGTQDGISVERGTFSGNIQNSGTITAQENGINVEVSTFAGTIQNSATITAGENGISIEAYAVGGNITNSGTIDAQEKGVSIDTSTFSANILNSGTVTAQQHGISIAAYSSFDGGITNSGTITSKTGIGIWVQSPSIAASISNTATGNITGAGAGILIGGIPSDGSGNSLTVFGAVNASGTIRNLGTINAKTGTGIGVLARSYSGSVTNFGSVTGARNGLVVAGTAVFSSSGPSFSAGWTSSGRIVNAAGATIAGTNGTGILVQMNTFSGLVTNAGTISGNNGIVVGSDATETFDGTIQNSGTVTGTKGVGIGILATTFSGNLVNTATGLITGGKIGIKVRSDSFFGGISNAGTVTGGKNGIFVSGLYDDWVQTFNGTIQNSGTVTGTTGVGIGVAASTFSGNFVNTGTGQISGGKTGASFRSTTFFGGISNAGTISGGSGPGLKLTTGTLFGEITNSGTISGKTGVLVSAGTAFGAGLLNTGIIASNSTAGATNAIDVSGVSSSFSIIQAAGAIIGGIAGNAFTKFDMHGGKLALSPTQRVTVGTYSQTAGTVQLAATPTQIGTVHYLNTAVYGGNLSVIPLAGFYGATTTYTSVFFGPTTATGSFGSFSSNSPLLKLLAPDYTDGTHVNLTLERQPFQSVAGLDPKLGSLATSLNTLANSGDPGAQALLGKLFGLTSQTYGAGVKSLGVQNLQSLQSLETQQQALVGEIQAHLANPSADAGTTQLAQLRRMGVQIASLDGLGDYDTQLAQAAPKPTSTGPLSVWTRAYGVFANAGNSGGNAGFGQTTAGAIVGVDYQLSDQLLVGAAANYAHTTVDFNDAVGNLKVNSYQGTLYGRYEVGPWYVNGTGGVAWNNYSNVRNVALNGTSATGDYDGQSYTAYGETGYKLAPAMAYGMALKPFVGVGYTHIHTDRYTESGAGAANLTVSTVDNNSLQSSLGLRASTTLSVGDGTSVLVPEVRVAWQHEFLDTSQTVNAAFAIAPTGTFTQTGAKFSRDIGVFGAGVMHQMSASTKLFLDYDAKVQGNYTAHAISAGLRLKF
jgi:fibronectin-binding autotransporter adhesin